MATRARFLWTVDLWMLPLWMTQLSGGGCWTKDLAVATITVDLDSHRLTATPVAVVATALDRASRLLTRICSGALGDPRLARAVDDFVIGWECAVNRIGVGGDADGRAAACRSKDVRSDRQRRPRNGMRWSVRRPGLEHVDSNPPPVGIDLMVPRPPRFPSTSTLRSRGFLDLNPRTSAGWIRRFVQRRGTGETGPGPDQRATARLMRQVVAALRAQGVLLAAILAGRVGQDVVGASVTLGWRQAPGGIDRHARWDRS